jgi:type I restriction enzyme S subunit
MKVKFGDVVRDVKTHADPDNYEYYIAGDHMDTENVHITRRGQLSDGLTGPAFMRLFKKGQILYGSRRTYLKKCAVADFDGICANTTFVLESNDDAVLLNDLLPFLILSDRFTEHSIKKSRGSVNPYVLFSDIAEFEFDLPPMDEQHYLAEVLWAFDNAKQVYKKLLKMTEELVKSRFVAKVARTSAKGGFALCIGISSKISL